MWEILTRDLFDFWFEEQNEETQIEVLAVIQLERVLHLPLYAVVLCYARVIKKEKTKPVSIRN